MKCVLLLFLTFSLSAQNRWEVSPQKAYEKFLVGAKIDNLQLSNNTKIIDNKHKLILILAFDSDCPMSRKLAPEVKRIEEEFMSKSVRFIHLSVSSFDQRRKVLSAYKSRGFQGELVFDDNKKVQSYFKMRTTCEVILIDSSGTVIFRGAINDQYGIGFTRETAKNHYLKDALTTSLKQQIPKVRLTSVPGCILESENLPLNLKSEVTFHNQISRIMQNRCQSCHRKDGVGPFELVSYNQVKGRSKMIKYVIEKKIMPPWFAEGGGPWQNDCSLSSKEERDILSWVKNKCPEGDEKDAPIPLKWDSKWQLDTPDLIINIPQNIKVPAEGKVPYINVFVQIPLKKDRWVSSMEIRSEQSQVLHHVLIMDDPTGSKKLNKRVFRGGTQGFFGALVPGQSLTEYPEGTGKALRAGSWLKFQLHYTPNGKAVEDKISLAVKFLDSPPEKMIRTVSASNARFSIPPNHPNFKIEAQYRFPVNATVLAFSPHTHLRGKSFKYELEYPDGRKKTVLDVPNYDFNWQLRYILQTPLKVPRGSKMICTAIYDNSSDNPANPDPNARVRYGDQTEDEMMIGYFEGYIGY